MSNKQADHRSCKSTYRIPNLAYMIKYNLIPKNRTSVQKGAQTAKTVKQSKITRATNFLFILLLFSFYSYMTHPDKSPHQISHSRSNTKQS